MSLKITMPPTPEVILQKKVKFGKVKKKCPTTQFLPHVYKLNLILSKADDFYLF